MGIAHTSESVDRASSPAPSSHPFTGYRVLFSPFASFTPPRIFEGRSRQHKIIVWNRKTVCLAPEIGSTTSISSSTSAPKPSMLRLFSAPKRPGSSRLAHIVRSSQPTSVMVSESWDISKVVRQRESNEGRQNDSELEAGEATEGEGGVTERME